MLARLSFLIAASLLTLVVLVAAVSNPQYVPIFSIVGLGQFKEIPTCLVMLISYLGGALMTASVWYFRSHRVSQETTKLEWAKEDAKLMAEVKSDHVKQLEAKVATLEAALSKALKKK